MSVVFNRGSREFVARQSRLFEELGRDAQSSDFLEAL